jgi:hypothetical protein
MIRFFAVVCTVSFLMVQAAFALEFQPLGSRSIGMGGAGVARSTGAMSPYWNPAALAFTADTVSISVVGGAAVQPGGSFSRDLDAISNLGDLNSTKSGTLTSPNIANSQLKLTNALTDYAAGDGYLRLSGNLAVGAQVRHLGFGVFGTAEAGAIPHADVNNILPTDAASLQSLAATGGTTPTTYFNAAQIATLTNAFTGIAGITNPSQIVNLYGNQIQSSTTPISSTDASKALLSLANAYKAGGGLLTSNASTVSLLGIALLEAPIAYGYEEDLGRYGKLGIGGALKYMYGEVFSRTQQVGVSTGNLTNNLDDYTRGSSSWGADVGVLYKITLADIPVSVGLVGKNLNTPEFDIPSGGGKVKVRPQTRAGACIGLLSWLDVAADLDVLPNETMVPGLKSQSLGGGIEFHPLSAVRFRVGGSTNVATGSSGAVTGGFTLGWPVFNLDIDGSYGLGKETYKGTTYPDEAKVQFSLNVGF